jgi:hypothetical protein
LREQTATPTITGTKWGALTAVRAGTMLPTTAQPRRSIPTGATSTSACRRNTVTVLPPPAQEGVAVAVAVVAGAEAVAEVAVEAEAEAEAAAGETVPWHASQRVSED